MIFLAVDDENLQLNKLVGALEEIAPNDKILSFNNPIKAYTEIQGINIDVAFLDIEMGFMSGVELAKKLKEMNPKINIIFVTGFTEYALEAFSIQASGYLTKPVVKEKLLLELQNLRYPMPLPKNTLDVRVQCFGNFEIYFKEEPIYFNRTKCKELLAYLVYKQGALIKTDELNKVLFNEEKSSYLRMIVSDLNKCLVALGIGNIFIRKFNAYGIDISKISCDYYDYVNGELYAVKKYSGEFMKQYKWAKNPIKRIK